MFLRFDNRFPTAASQYGIFCTCVDHRSSVMSSFGSFGFLLMNTDAKSSHACHHIDVRNRRLHRGLIQQRIGKTTSPQVDVISPNNNFVLRADEEHCWRKASTAITSKVYCCAASSVIQPELFSAALSNPHCDQNKHPGFSRRDMLPDGVMHPVIVVVCEYMSTSCSSRLLQ